MAVSAKLAAEAGEIHRVAGPVVTATGLRPRMYDVMLVGKEQLMGEVIRLRGDRTTIQVYEDTSGIRPGEPVVDTKQPLNLELGPGLLGSIYDGIQRPLPVLMDKMGDFILRGVRAPGLDRQKTWPFQPTVKAGDTVQPGQLIGTVQEAKFVEHRITVPPKMSGKVKDVKAGSFRVDEPIVELDTAKLTLMQTWPVRTPRPVREKMMPSIPLITGQRVFDFLFPIAKGGTAAIPGGFGTGKCVVGETPIQMRDGTSITAKEAFQSARGPRRSSNGETFITMDRPIPVWTLSHRRILAGTATAAYRGRTDCLVELRTAGGRELLLTPIHRLFTAKGEVSAAKLAVGDRIIVSENPATGHAVADVITAKHVRWGRETVYDLTVPGPHNFLGGNLPTVLHNTVSEHQLAKWCDAKIVVYIGCGERGNEMTEVLTEFPHLEDPQTGRPLMERTVLIANTSNMPVAAREASVYTGMTIAEYYRDMGYDVALMADSTSRWAEAMREISSRLEEMPGEEGFPAYLSARLSEFYERAGRVKTLAGPEGSISVVGAVSPSGGDFSEPVTQGTLRITKVFWALDTKLRERRHFPAVNWLTSYSLYSGLLDPWYRKNIGEEWPELRAWASKVLQEEAELEEIVRLVGADALPEDQQLTLEVARMIREYFLQQNAFHKVDTFATLARQIALIRAVRQYFDLGQKALKLDVSLKDIAGIKSRELLARVKFEEKYDEEIQRAVAQMEDEFRKLEVA